MAKRGKRTLIYGRYPNDERYIERVNVEVL